MKKQFKKRSDDKGRGSDRKSRDGGPEKKNFKRREEDDSFRGKDVDKSQFKKIDLNDDSFKRGKRNQRSDDRGQRSEKRGGRGREEYGKRKTEYGKRGDGDGDKKSFRKRPFDKSPREGRGKAEGGKRKTEYGKRDDGDKKPFFKRRDD